MGIYERVQAAARKADRNYDYELHDLIWDAYNQQTGEVEDLIRVCNVRYKR